MAEKSHVLYVDDDEDIVFIQERILARYGYDVSVFLHPTDALEHFRSYPKQFDIAIVDLVMPTMNGDQLACELKKLNPTLPVVLCTGFGSEIAEQQVKDLGLNGFLIKPISRNIMLETVSRLVK